MLVASCRNSVLLDIELSINKKKTGRDLISVTPEVRAALEIPLRDFRTFDELGLARYVLTLVFTSSAGYIVIKCEIELHRDSLNRVPEHQN